MRIAIMGAGSLGTILGAYLSRAGYDITLVDVNRAHVDALNQHGAKICGHVDMVVPVVACTPEEMQGTFDLFFYMTKQTYNDVAIPQMQAHSDERTLICSTQNGIPEIPLCEAFQETQILGASVGWGGTWVEPGVSMLTSAPETNHFYIGAASGTPTKATEEVAGILRKMCHVEVLDDLLGVRWAKVIMNCCFSAMNTVIGGTFRDVWNSDKAMECIIHIGKEGVAVANASGNPVATLEGWGNWADVFCFDDSDSQKACVERCRKLWFGAQDLTASMLQDVQKGRKCEIDFLNGVICRTGQKFNVPTPVNDTVVAIIKKIEAGELEPTISNLEYFRFS